MTCSICCCTTATSAKTDLALKLRCNKKGVPEGRLFRVGCALSSRHLPSAKAMISSPSGSHRCPGPPPIHLVRSPKTSRSSSARSGPRTIQFLLRQPCIDGMLFSTLHLHFGHHLETDTVVLAAEISDVVRRPGSCMPNWLQGIPTPRAHRLGIACEVLRVGRIGGCIRSARRC